MDTVPKLLQENQYFRKHNKLQSLDDPNFTIYVEKNDICEDTLKGNVLTRRCYYFDEDKDTDKEKEREKERRLKFKKTFIKKDNKWLLHNVHENKAAILSYHPNGTRAVICHYNSGTLMHKSTFYKNKERKLVYVKTDNTKLITEYYQNGKVYLEKKDINQNTYSEIIRYNIDGDITYATRRKNGILHSPFDEETKEYLPSLVLFRYINKKQRGMWDETASPKHELEYKKQWHNEGKLHSFAGNPSYLEYQQKDDSFEEYFVKHKTYHNCGLLHNEQGPASVQYRENYNHKIKPHNTQYYLNGEEVEQSDIGGSLTKACRPNN